MGYAYAVSSEDHRLKVRAEGFKNFLESTRSFLLAASVLSKNEATASMLDAVQRKYAEFFAEPSVKQRVLSAWVTALAFKESLRLRIFSDVIQPPLKCIKYRVDAVDDSGHNRQIMAESMGEQQATA
jgi:hypothetical protein